MQASPTVGRIPELDGLRGFAALVVVVSHYVGEVRHGVSALMLGWLGVDLFFVLSGFLMGSIILRRHSEPGFVASFYMRRAARIIPIYFVVVCGTILMAGLTRGHIWSDQPFAAPVYLAFLSNVAMSFWGDGGEWLKPTWTLAVEEQFYLVLPLLVIWVPRRVLVPVLLGLCAFAIAFRYAVYDINPIAALMLLPSRMDLLIGGVLLAYAWQHFDLSRFLPVFRIVPLVAMLVLLSIVAIFGNESVFVIFNPTVVGIGVASFILAALLGSPEGRRYRSPILRSAGRISYALYLVHQPVSGTLHGVILGTVPDIGSLPQMAVTLLAFATSIAIAAASWKWLEQPILNLVPSSSSGCLARVPDHAASVAVRSRFTLAKPASD